MLGKKISTLLLVFCIVLPLYIPVQVQSQQQKIVLNTAVTVEDISSLNPLLGSSVPDWWIFLFLYDRLAIFAPPDFHVQPWLATSWELDSSGTVWTLHLTHNATFHDGQPLTSEDVKFSIDYIKQYQFGFWLPVVADITDVKTPDQYTVVITTAKAVSYFTSFVMPRMPILPKHIWEKIDKPEEFANDHPVGSGPYTFVEYKPAEYIRFAAYDGYWKGRPHVDEVIEHLALPADTAIIQAKKGELDLIGLDTPYVKAAEEDPNLKVVVSQNIYFDQILFNSQRAPLNSKEFRHALAYAIDKQDLINRVLLGYGDVVDTPGSVPAYAFWYNKDVTKYPYDPDKAKQMLDNLGFIDRNKDGFREYPNGTTIQLILTSESDYPVYVRLADLVVAQLAAIGLKAVNTPVEWTALSKALNSRDYDMATWGYTVSPDPQQYLSRVATIGGVAPYWSAGEMQNDTFNQLFDEQKFAVDINKRQAIIFQMEAIMAEELPFVPIWSGNIIEAYRADRFTGFIPLAGISGIYNKLNWLSVKPVVAPPPSTSTTATTQVVEVIPTWIYAVVALLVIVAVASLAVAAKRKRA